MTITVGQKGNVPLPEEVLRDIGVHPGDALEVCADGEDIILRKVAPPSAESLLDILRGLEGLPIPERGRSPVRDLKLFFLRYDSAKRH